MGLGRRKRSDYLSDELNKRHSAFLEDTGNNWQDLQMSFCTGDLTEISILIKGILMGFGKRSPEKRHYPNSFLGDTGR